MHARRQVQNISLPRNETSCKQREGKICFESSLRLARVSPDCAALSYACMCYTVTFLSHKVETKRLILDVGIVVTHNRCAWLGACAAQRFQGFAKNQFVSPLAAAPSPNSGIQSDCPRIVPQWAPGIAAAKLINSSSLSCGRSRRALWSRSGVVWPIARRIEKGEAA